MASAAPIRAAALTGLLVIRSSCADMSSRRPNRRSVDPAAADSEYRRCRGDFSSRSITLGKGKSIVVDFPRDIKDVLIADPKVANAVVRSSRRAYIIAID